MSVNREHVDVRVRNRTLWIGTDAYPLHTVARVTAAELEPDRMTAVRQYAVTVALWLFPATIVSAVTPDAASVVVTVTALTWFTARTVALGRSLRATRYELRIDTHGRTHRLLVGDNLTTISEIGFRITEAINDPTLEFHVRTETIRSPESRSHPQREEPTDRLNLS